VTAPLQAVGVTKRFRRRGEAVDALVDVDLELRAGALTVVTGPSLAGKTTLVHVLAGWEEADAGAVRWAGGRVPTWSELTVVTQAFSLVEELTVEENVLFAARAAGAAVDVAHADAVMERIGLAPLRRRLAGEVSVGERQRVMVARALVTRPPVLLADEPVTHQDQQHAEIVLQLIAEQAAAGSACLVATRSDVGVEGWGEQAHALEEGRLRAARTD
jgi:putative ABC transport system ATP-binding protein